jgi:hypothetical protein
MKKFWQVLGGVFKNINGQSQNSKLPKTYKGI